MRRGDDSEGKRAFDGGSQQGTGVGKKKAILEGVGLSGVSRQNMKNGSGEANREKCHVDQSGWTFFFPQKAGMATVSFGLFEEQMSDKSINTNTGSGERIS